MKQLLVNQGFAAWLIGLIVILVLVLRHIVDVSALLTWLGGGGATMIGTWKKNGSDQKGNGS